MLFRSEWLNNLKIQKNIMESGNPEKKLLYFSANLLILLISIAIINYFGTNGSKVTPTGNFLQISSLVLVLSGVSLVVLFIALFEIRRKQKQSSNFLRR